MADELDQLIFDLAGSTPPGASSTPPGAGSSPPTTSIGQREIYQIPVKTGKNGQPLDEKNQPWILGRFAPNTYLNPKHPHGHPAEDFGAPKGTPIYPIASGQVIETAEYSKGGKTCKVAHEDGAVVSYYAHMNTVEVAVGATVTQTSVLGTVGNTGSAFDTAPHVHLEIKVNGQHQNPDNIIGKEVGSVGGKKAQLIQKYQNKIGQLIWQGGQLAKIAELSEKITKLQAHIIDEAKKDPES